MKPSASTGTASSHPMRRATASRVASVGAGTILSTMPLGKVTLSSIHAKRSSAAPASRRNSATRLRVLSPALSMLSHDRTVRGAPPSAKRRMSPRATRPIDVTGPGPSPARSAAIPGSAQSSPPVRASLW